MMTVNEVSKLTGVSIRALQYYDKIGLLHPAQYTEAGYRLYDDAALERLQQILLFRELEFPLKQIQTIPQSPDFDRDKALGAAYGADGEFTENIDKAGGNGTAMLAEQAIAIFLQINIK